MQLREVGPGKFQAKCPFHNDKNPSLYLYTQGNSFYCFGCNAKGGIWDFVKLLNGWDNGQVFAFLKESGLIEVHRGQRLLNNELRDYFADCLARDDQVMCLVSDLGFSKVDVAKYRLGFCPASALGNLVARFGAQQLRSAGLLSAGSGSLVLNNRLVIPLPGSNGDTVAFQGRSLFADSFAKYLSSTNTESFTKSTYVYGLHNLANARGCLLLVEGVKDYIRVETLGFATVSSLSCVWSEKQRERLLTALGHRRDLEIYVFFDGDEAGHGNGSELCAWLGARYGGKVYQVATPVGMDPADLAAAGRPSIELLLYQARYRKTTATTRLAKRGVPVGGSFSEKLVTLLGRSGVFQVPAYRAFLKGLDIADTSVRDATLSTPLLDDRQVRRIMLFLFLENSPLAASLSLRDLNRLSSVKGRVRLSLVRDLVLPN